jgi:hypothetical protein
MCHYGGEVTVQRVRWRKTFVKIVAAVAIMARSAFASAQAVPSTVGETLSGKRVVLAEAMAGHATVLIMGFSKDAGDPCADWMRAVRGDPAFAGVTVYEAAMLAGAPGFVRPMIKAGIRKGFSPAEQESFVVLTADEKAWKAYFQVGNDKDPYVALLDHDGHLRWHGSGRAKNMLEQMRAALRQ